jgi:GGDEF domain-containing protein
VLAPETDSAAAVTLGERCRELVEWQTFEHGGGSIPVTVSIGVAIASSSIAVSQVVDLAGAALATAKKLGGNRVEVHRRS